jgi:signal transduction histidine kinase/ActR/RegA family two-component response regulator
VAENLRRRDAGEVSSLQYEFRGLRRDGDAVDIEVFGSRTTYDGRPAVVGTLVDVTGRKRTEQEQARTEKLRSLGVLAGGIAHDFNNLLAAILGNLSVARERDGGDELLREVLAEAEQATRRAGELTRQLLTFSRGGEPVKRRISVEPVLRSASSFAVRGSAVRCECEIAPGLPAVEADEGQLSQVVHNLVLNAVQAMPGGGVVRVRAEEAPPDTDAGGAARWVRIQVEDDGPGVAPEVAHQIFDPYFTTKSNGTGLGLATVHSIVARHGGHVRLDSQPGRGAIFRVHLPAVDGAPQPRPAVAAALGGGSGRVAVMDDDELVRRAAMRMLSRLGYSPVAARDGAELLRLVDEAREEGRPIDAVIMDLTIPGGMGGKEAMLHLRQRAPGVKAIVSSGYSSDPVMAEFAAHGFAGVVAKPYQLEDLAAALRRALAGPDARA